ncbi:MAG: response regulator transcription factor [Clostridia bacterium]|nr:response regulator transcription factor [Oscillospiraceae bacterium]MBQ7005097.1 response regulator transcription factor [Clostridia bacterium]
MFKILVIEDDKDLCHTMCTYLNHNGYEATGVLSAEAAYQKLDETLYDLIISDIMLPGTDGYEIANSIRSTDSDTPILFVTARDDFFSKQKGFLAGIDDYMVKPVDLGELLLRIGAILRRSRIACSRKLTVGSLVMDMDERTTKLDGNEIPMTAREFNLLYKLLSYPGKTFTRSQLMDEFWESGTTSGLRTVDVYMAKLRDRFSSCDGFEIVTVHGLGYKAVIK